MGEEGCSFTEVFNIEVREAGGREAWTIALDKKIHGIKHFTLGGGGVSITQGILPLASEWSSNEDGNVLLKIYYKTK